MPFDDTSYKPELFFLTSNQSRNRDRLAGLFFQAGAQHESNGQAETLSRSTNFLYFKPILIFYHAPSGYGLQVSPGVWTYWENEDETNPDLNDYRGYVDLQLKFGRADSFVMETHFWPAKKGNSVQCDITYPMNRHFKTNLNLYLHVQYANRLAESLISYKERSKALRIGFSIVR
jgi:outer membrane phospholipase A